MSATTRIQGGASGGPMNGMFPSQVAARGGMQQFAKKRMLPGGQPTDIGGMVPGGPQPAGQPTFMANVLGQGPQIGGGGGPTGSPTPAAPVQTTLSNSLWNGKTSLINGNPADIADLRTGTAGMLASNLGNISSDYSPQINSVDQLGGAHSPFFQNMMMQLQPAFDQRRALAIAAAKESAGNLTGSGLGNTIGTAVNRSLGDEQAILADYANKGVGQELSRQTSLATLNNQTSNSDADRFAQLLGLMTTAGVAPGQLTQSGGISSLIGPAANIFGQWLANRNNNKGSGSPSGTMAPPPVGLPPAPPPMAPIGGLPGPSLYHW